MSLTSGPINETEQAAEKATDHLFPQFTALIAAVFAEIRKTRLTITIDVSEKP